ncbi:DUF4383 domain-containing protein [Lentzea sp. PSKA42]|uniref:DUF4383 domain-containing protein n=1 Tax=Lentzea indica TaxID=2604800 RepID=A0ABX1FYN0_9PSEU|nr:DUF4383 domain-containing protein [Lentzea indica]NKE63671.1 DUF4383 domain-containing protein [Lentzea indica]
MIAVWICRVLGVLFTAAGVVTFVAGDSADFAHNTVHLVSGLAALGFGFTGWARAFAVAFGGAYLTLGAVGLALGELHAGPLHLMTGDNVFHVGLGSVVLLGGLLSRHRQVAR